MSTYRNLTNSDGLLPPAARFIFDREGRSDEQIAAVARDSQNMVKFLQLRMFENYLLYDDVVAAAYNEAGRPFDLATTTQAVRDWIDENGGAQQYFIRRRAPLPRQHAEWRSRVDGAKLLKDMYAALSGARLEFRKTSDTPRLAVHLAVLHEAEARRLKEEMLHGVELG